MLDGRSDRSEVASQCFAVWEENWREQEDGLSTEIHHFLVAGEKTARQSEQVLETLDSLLLRRPVYPSDHQFLIALLDSLRVTARVAVESTVVAEPSVVGFAAAVFAVVGSVAAEFAVVGSAVVEFVAAGFAVVGSAVVGSAVAGFVVVGSAVAEFVAAEFAVAGFVAVVAAGLAEFVGQQPVMQFAGY